MVVDLHCHSHFSDGTLTPEALIERAQHANLSLFSITDHDTLAAHRYLAGKPPQAVPIIPGVEISTNLETTELHLVALNVDIHHTELNRLLDYHCELRINRAEWVIAKLLKLGFPDISAHLAEIQTGPVICRTHLAKALLRAEIVPDYERAFKRFLGRKGKVWKRPEWQSMTKVIDTVHQAGGVVILAHPTKYRLSSGKLSWIIEQFAAAGGDAIEVNYSGLSPNHKHYLKRMALKHELKVSVGSDFHHPEQRYAPIGGFHQIDSSLEGIWEQLAL